MSRRVIYLLGPLPALAAGGVVIVRLGGGPGMVLFYVGCAAAGSVLVRTSGRRGADQGGRAALALGASGLAVVASTLVFEGREGVLRWVELGPFQLNASLLLSPFIIVAGFRLMESGRAWPGAMTMLALQAVHVVQPDAAQATGVATALVALAVGRRHKANALASDLSAVGAIAMATVAWRRADPLPGVEHVLQSAVELDVGLGAAAIVGTAALITAFAWDYMAGARSGQRRPIVAALGAYLAALIAASQLGEFPVPVVGYGASTVLSYYCAAAAAVVTSGRVTAATATAVNDRVLGSNVPGVESVVRASALTKEYGGDSPPALRGVDVALGSGCFTSVMGPSGSGKSTLLHLLGGMDRPTSGEVEVGGKLLSKLDDDALSVLRRDDIGFVFQSFNLVPVLSAAENVALPAVIAGEKPSAYADRLDDALRTVDLEGHRAKLPSQMSGGQQQRVALARALFNRPTIVLADEPTGNLDSATGAEVLALLRRIVDDLGTTVLMVTHDPRAAAMSDEVILLRDGEVAGRLPLSRDMLLESRATQLTAWLADPMAPMVSPPAPRKPRTRRRNVASATSNES